MTGTGEENELIDELRRRLIGEGLASGVDLLVREHDDAVRVHIMTVDLGRLGVMLAALSNAAELPDPSSLSSRLVSGRNDGADGRWQYELIAGRYPHSNEIVFSALIQLPGDDLPEILFRQRRCELSKLSRLCRRPSGGSSDAHPNENEFSWQDDRSWAFPYHLIRGRP
jgi:hypothetical protein